MEQQRSSLRQLSAVSFLKSATSLTTSVMEIATSCGATVIGYPCCQIRVLKTAMTAMQTVECCGPRSLLRKEKAIQQPPAASILMIDVLYYLGCWGAVWGGVTGVHSNALTAHDPFPFSGDFIHTYTSSQMSVLDRCTPRREQEFQPRRSGFLSPLLLSGHNAVAFSAAEPAKPTMGEILRKASKRAMGGGIPGAGTYLSVPRKLH